MGPLRVRRNRGPELVLSRGVFHPLWQRRHSPVAESGFLGSVRIRRVLTEGEYDDTSDFMGKNYGYLQQGNAPHRGQMGWVPGAASGPW